MRIAIGSDSFAPKIDGVSDTAGIIARMLHERGHDVLVVAPAPGGRHHDGVAVARIPAVSFPLYPELRLAYRPGAIRDTVRAFRPEGAVVLTPGPIGVAFVRALRPSVRLINVYTTDIPRYLDAYRLGMARGGVDRLLRWMSSRAVATYCPTELVRTELEARQFCRLSVWGRGVDRGLFNPQRASSAMRYRLSGGEPEKPLVLYVGRLAREKRLLDLYRAAQMLPGVRFALVGDGPDRDMLERCFSNVPALFTGYLRGVPLAEAFASSDLFAFPSDSETFGQVVLQAMASGVPPVVVEGSAPAEFVRTGEVGVHVPARHPVALAAAIRELSENRPMLGRMAAAAAVAAEQYSWEALVSRLERELLPVGEGERGAVLAPVG